MIRRFILAGTILCISCAGFAQTANPNSSETTKKIFNYLKSLNKRESKRIISGQQMNAALEQAVSFDSSAGKIFKSTGKWVGLLGLNYQRTGLGLPSDLKAGNKLLIDHFNNGGLVTVMCSLSNPWNSTGNANDTTNSYRLNELIFPGTLAYQKFHIQLDSIASGLKELKDSGVTVLLRLFQENNAPWFWWGSRSSTKPTGNEWIAIWIHCFNYLTVEKNLNNLLWVFSPSAKESSISNPSFKRDDFYYPGNQYVDILGVDVYNDTLDVPFYNTLKSYGKPLAVCEFGMSKQTAGKAKNYDYRIFLNQIKNKYPDFIYWMSWNDFTNQQNTIYYGMTNQNNVVDILNDAWVINRNEINWNVTAVEIDKLPLHYALEQNYPNPFNPETVIAYTLPARSFVSLKVYDLLGRQMAVLVDEDKRAGNYRVKFNGTDFSSGVYFYKLQTEKATSIKKMLLVK
ncbi:MAG: hypothetical protein CVV24_00070 [Ignavibacteriae bacterium HGW-Ignavibacteriae-3]|nr:MAG: hypothetical protein CVV24_00070 [Ignavibacteriae bacterium HGW-Ignavibacteriae-3]